MVRNRRIENKAQKNKEFFTDRFLRVVFIVNLHIIKLARVGFDTDVGE